MHVCYATWTAWMPCGLTWQKWKQLKYHPHGAVSMSITLGWDRFFALNINPDLKMITLKWYDLAFLHDLWSLNGRITLLSIFRSMWTVCYLVQWPVRNLTCFNLFINNDIKRLHELSVNFLRMKPHPMSDWLHYMYLWRHGTTSRLMSFSPRSIYPQEI